eukprot:TRINITY_DN1128_c0_g1_i1.p2 TRINITY_DN1128_c0_g1~~TRINITY_DN1128_c0_g1_i1.p2  ORF type:complete len:107 (-),score=10.10 TRINITY_DN1128_c0_g1_i1:422-742(-)
MSNVHTLQDLEDDKPNSEPLPNPWSKSKVETTEYVFSEGADDLPSEIPVASTTRVAYINMNGQVALTPENSSKGKICCYVCFPCLLIRAVLREGQNIKNALYLSVL